MDEERLAFEAMMNEVQDSDEDDEDSEFVVQPKGVSRAAQSKTKTVEGQYHQSKATVSAKSESNSRKDSKNVRESTPPLKFKGEAQKALPKDDNESEIANFGVTSVVKSSHAASRDCTVSMKQHTDFVATKRWLLRPCHPQDPTTLCHVIREKHVMSGMVLRVFIEPKVDTGPKLIMSAKKFVNKRTSYYLVSLLSEPEERGGDDILGKVRANAVGSKYLLTDHGLAPEKSAAPSTLRKEHGVLKFRFDPDSPSSMEVHIPAVSKNGVAMVWQPTSDAESIEECIERGDLDRLQTLVNKKPKWDASQRGHVLNFEGRVTQSSVKNFQLVAQGCDEVCLQFGRVGKDKFTMDVRYPLSLFQAFGLCIACMDKKIADRQGYSFVKKMMKIP